MKVIIYTDGSCEKNPGGRGGYSAIIIFENETIEITGGEPSSTNNRMELMGAIAALEYLKEPSEVELHCDSAYVVNCFLQKWYLKWEENGWRNSAGKPVENKDLWERLLSSVRKHTVKFVKVKGHSDNVFNNRCDELAKNAYLAQSSTSLGN